MAASTIAGTHCLPIHFAKIRARQCLNRARLFERGDAFCHRLPHRIRATLVTRVRFDHCFSGLTILLVWHAEHADSGHLQQIKNYAFDLRRINVFPASLEKFPLRLATPIVQGAVPIETTQVAGVVPAFSAGEGRRMRIPPIAGEDQRARSTISPA